MRAIIKHPAFERGKLALLRALDTQMRGQIIFVVGMSGAGKSEIRYDSMRAYAGHPGSWEKGRLPVISVRATPTDRSTFNPKEFMFRLYLAITDPDFSWVANRAGVDGPDGSHIRMEEKLRSTFCLGLRKRYTEHEMRTYVERTALFRGTKAIFVEEAASMTYTHHSKRPIDHMVNYMCLAEEIGASLVMFGVPRVASLWEGNAEVLRRSRFVFVDRYRHDNPEDRGNFERLVATVADAYRFSVPNLVRETLDLVYASSAGVFGEVAAFYRRADDLRSLEGCSAICRRHIEGAVSSEATLTTLHQEAALFDFLRSPATASVIQRVLQ